MEYFLYCYYRCCVQGRSTVTYMKVSILESQTKYLDKQLQDITGYNLIMPRLVIDKNKEIVKIKSCLGYLVKFLEIFA